MQNRARGWILPGDRSPGRARRMAGTLPPSGDSARAAGPYPVSAGFCPGPLIRAHWRIIVSAASLHPAMIWLKIRFQYESEHAADAQAECVFSREPPPHHDLAEKLSATRSPDAQAECVFSHESPPRRDPAEKLSAPRSPDAQAECVFSRESPPRRDLAEKLSATRSPDAQAECVFSHESPPRHDSASFVGNP